MVSIKKGEGVKKWVILFSVWGAFVGASENNRLTAYGIPSYNKSPGIEWDTIHTPSLVGHLSTATDWIGYFKDNHHEYLSMSLENTLDLFQQVIGLG